ncbi:ubiquinol-cytochrome-c reductase complex assembly factor 2 [Diabrotica undecimpunctata]|uniref:ubiquinol-cytochrome-c reductase complex assembly factor 2 n=1 Tax=Diabrotica undecimpunctata TaxID=50387 RepID=UPI003B642947
MASSAGVYKRILSLLEKWPVDKNKIGGRDIGEHLRHYINTSYKENKFETNHSYWDKQYLAIQRLVNNTHKNKYKRTLNTSSTGLTAEQCNIALSNEYLDEVNQKEKSFFRKLISIKPDP